MLQWGPSLKSNDHPFGPFSLCLLQPIRDEFPGVWDPTQGCVETCISVLIPFPQSSHSALQRGPPLISGMDGQTTPVSPKALLNTHPPRHTQTHTRTRARTHTRSQDLNERGHPDSSHEFYLTSIKKHAEPWCEDNAVRLQCFIDREKGGKQLFALDANKLSFTFKAENLCPWQDVWGQFQRY